MARITAVIASSHSPFLFQPIEWWRATLNARPGNTLTDVPDDREFAHQRHRIDNAFLELRDIFRNAKPDLMVVFGDDQHEQFRTSNMPPFAIYAGGPFSGYRTVAYESPLGSGYTGQRVLKPKTSEHWTEVETRPELAKSLVAGLMADGFDPALMLSLPRADEGMGHAFMRPTSRLSDDRFDIPMLPVLVNCFYAPQPSAARCVAFARAVRRAIEAWPDDLNVVVLGSGGLWHTPGSADSYIDAEFDQQVLEGITSGDVDRLARYFDAWRPSPQKAQLRCYGDFDGGTGMAGGIGSGAGETRNWIMAAAVADRPGVIVDYIPVQASPCGMAFAYWPL